MGQSVSALAEFLNAASKIGVTGGPECIDGIGSAERFEDNCEVHHGVAGVRVLFIRDARELVAHKRQILCLS